MTTITAQSAACVLVASDNAGNAALVKKLLSTDFDHVECTTDPDRSTEDFDRHHPSVLVLAFDELEKAERFYLSLYRHSATIHQQPHWTVILCRNEEVKRVSELCIKQVFDDYVLFWPFNHDGPRLITTVHVAIRTLATQRAAGPTASQLAAQARQLAALESLLDRRLVEGERHIDRIAQAVSQTHADPQGAHDGTSIRSPRASGGSVEPLKQWVQEFKQDMAPHAESVRTLGALADRVPHVVLVVDDDEFQCKVVTRLLEGEPFQVLSANGGTAAFAILRKTRPDVILMDLRMPDMDGIEVTRRLKSQPHLAEIPIVMLTGRSEGEAVIKSRQAGACDFIVKPTDKATLLMKLARALGRSASP